MGEGNSVAFAEIEKEMGNGRGGARGTGVDEVLGKELVISNIELLTGMDGESVLVIHTKDGQRIRSGSKVLIKQAPFIKKRIDAGQTVTATIVKQKSQTGGRSYYTFK